MSWNIYSIMYKCIVFYFLVEVFTIWNKDYFTHSKDLNIMQIYIYPYIHVLLLPIMYKYIVLYFLVVVFLSCIIWNKSYFTHRKIKISCKCIYVLVYMFCFSCILSGDHGQKSFSACDGRRGWSNQLDFFIMYMCWNKEIKVKKKKKKKGVKAGAQNGVEPAYGCSSLPSGSQNKKTVIL